MKFDFGYKKHQGSREKQDDHLGVKSLNSSTLIAVVADGLGAYQGGDIASKTAVKYFFKAYQESSGSKRIKDRLYESLEKSNRKILEKIKAHPDKKKMGTTLVAIIIEEDKLHWISVGDSILAVINKDGYLKINETHNLLSNFEDLYRKGKVTKEDIQSLKEPESLTSSLGKNTIAQVNYSFRTLNEGDSVLLASDGILSLSEKEIASIINKRGRGKSSCVITELLIDRVLKKNVRSQDNVALILVKFLNQKNILGQYKKTTLALFLLVTLFVFVTLFFVLVISKVENKTFCNSETPQAGSTFEDNGSINSEVSNSGGNQNEKKSDVNPKAQSGEENTEDKTEDTEENSKNNNEVKGGDTSNNQVNNDAVKKDVGNDINRENCDSEKLTFFDKMRRHIEHIKEAFND